MTGFGAAWLDVDNDGWLDMLTVNGTVSAIEALVSAGDPFPYHQPKQLFMNNGDGTFRDASREGGAALAVSDVGRGAAFGDLDNDGDTDVIDHARSTGRRGCCSTRSGRASTGLASAS